MPPTSSTRSRLRGPAGRCGRPSNILAPPAGGYRKLLYRLVPGAVFPRPRLARCAFDFHRKVFAFCVASRLRWFRLFVFSFALGVGLLVVAVVSPLRFLVSRLALCRLAVAAVLCFCLVVLARYTATTRLNPPFVSRVFILLI